MIDGHPVRAYIGNSSTFNQPKEVIMFIAVLLFLFVFVGLSVLRTHIENKASQTNDSGTVGKMIAGFFHVTGGIIAIAFLLLLLELAQPSTEDFSLHGASLLLAVALSLLVGGEPQPLTPVKSNIRS